MNIRNRNTHRRFPERLAFTLNNRIRRFLQPPDQIISKLSLRPSDVVMDFGCGPGFYTIPLAKATARIYALDISPRMLEKTMSSAKKNGVIVEPLRSDGTEIKLPDETVDLIFLNHVFHEIENKPRVLSEFSRIMKRSGRLVIVERTHGGLFAGKLGPPVIDQTEVIQEIQESGLTMAQTIVLRKDSMVIAQKEPKNDFDVKRVQAAIDSLESLSGPRLDCAARPWQSRQESAFLPLRCFSASRVDRSSVRALSCICPGNLPIWIVRAAKEITTQKTASAAS